MLLLVQENSVLTCIILHFNVGRQTDLLDTNQGLFYFKGKTYIAWGFDENVENFFTDRMMILEVGGTAHCAPRHANRFTAKIFT